MTATTLATTAASGKGISEIVLDAATGRDCRILEGTLRSDRQICEVKGSYATEQDFKGVATLTAYIERNANGGKPGHHNRQSSSEIVMAQSR